MTAPEAPRRRRSILALATLFAPLGCTATMDNAWRHELLTPTTPTDFQMTAQDVYPMTASTLDGARGKMAPLVCDAKGPADAAAKEILAAVPAAVSKLKKSKNPCAQGEGKGSADAKGANLCWNATTAQTATTKLKVACESGKVTVAMDGGTFELEKLYGTIWKYNGSKTLALLGWNAEKTRAIVIKTSLDHPEQNDHMAGAFLAIHLPYLADAAAREMIPTIPNFDDFDLFMVDGGKKGYLVHAPRDTFVPSEIETAGFQIE